MNDEKPPETADEARIRAEADRNNGKQSNTSGWNPTAAGAYQEQRDFLDKPKN